MDNVSNSDCTGGESRTGISLSIPSLTLKWLFYFLLKNLFFHWAVECANVLESQNNVFMISHNNIIQF